MDKLSFESGPEKEGSVEDRIAKAFKEFAFSDDVDNGLDLFQANLSKVLPGAMVKRIHQGPQFTPSDIYYVEKIEDSPGGQRPYLEVSFEGKDYLLPAPIRKGEFVRMLCGYSKSEGKQLFFDKDDIRPVPLVEDGNGRLVTK